MKIKFNSIALAALLLGSLAAHSSVLIDGGNVGGLLNSGGSNVQVGSVGLIVADTDGNGLVDPYNTTLSAGLYLAGGTSDLILGAFQAIDFGGENGIDFSGLNFSYSGSFGVGDNLYLVWFPTITALNSVVGGGVSYGSFRTDSADTNIAYPASIGWTAPTDGGTYQIVSLSAALGGDPAVSSGSFTASLTTVPEPTTWALLATGLTTVVVLRRRRRA